MQYIKNLKDSEHIIEIYYCKEKKSSKSKTGKNYLSLTLQDKTGQIEAKVWDLHNEIQNFEQGDFIKVDSIVNFYQNNLQLKINKIRKAQTGEYNPKEYVLTTEKNIDSMLEEFKNYINSIKNSYIKKLLENFFLENTIIINNFKTHSAAKTMHHNYLGGLLEHTLSIVQICDFLSSRYENVNRDILIAGAMLHDICKIYELSSLPQNDYTDDGQLLGHIVICTQLIRQEILKIENFPHEIESLIVHCVISHHGNLEYGSPKEPKTIEALIIHLVDTLDSRVNMFEKILKNENLTNKWSSYNRTISTNVRLSDF